MIAILRRSMSLSRAGMSCAGVTRLSCGTPAKKPDRHGVAAGPHFVPHATVTGNRRQSTDRPPISAGFSRKFAPWDQVLTIGIETRSRLLTLLTERGRSD